MTKRRGTNFNNRRNEAIKNVAVDKKTIVNRDHSCIGAGCVFCLNLREADTALEKAPPIADAQPPAPPQKQILVVQEPHAQMKADYIAVFIRMEGPKNADWDAKRLRREAEKAWERFVQIGRDVGVM